MDISLRRYNRDNASLVLRDCGDNCYTLDCEGDKFYCEYIRLIGNDRDYPEAVDPPGGPFISLGVTYDNKKVSMITAFKGEPIKFYLEDETDRA